MAALEFLGIYGADIARFSEYLDRAMEEIGFTDGEIADVYAYTAATFNDQLKSGNVSLNNFSIQLMRQMAYETVAELSVRFPDTRFDYKIDDVRNAHLIVNDEVLEASEYIKSLSKANTRNAKDKPVERD